MATPSSCGGSIHYSVHSNPNLHHCGTGNEILARSTSHPPEMFYWEESTSPPLTFRPFPTYSEKETQTDYELLYRYVNQNSKIVLEMLGLDSDKILSKRNIRKSFSIPSDRGQVHISVQGNCLNFKDVALDIDDNDDDDKGENCPFLWNDSVVDGKNYQIFEHINPQNSVLKFRKTNHSEI